MSGHLGYGSVASAPSSASAIVHTTAAGRGVPITEISFPHSPLPIPVFSDFAPPLPALNPSAPVPPLPHVVPSHYEDHADTAGVPHFRKLTFPTFDGKSDPLGWLNKCDHFFRAQRTPEHDKVWLASFHTTDVAQEWYYMLERDAGDVTAINWPQFKTLC